MTQGSGSVVLRGGTVLTVDATHRVLPDTDVLVIGDRIAAIGPDLPVPEGTREIDASGGIVMPGMIDTHRHMWQTAMRGYGADWTLTQYFVWYYLESGRHFRPEDVHAGNLLAALEAVDAGVTTCVDWSHGLQTADHADAAVDALQVGARPVRARLRQHPAGARGSGRRRRSSRRSPQRRIDAADDMLAFQMAFDVTGDPAFPERAAFEVGPRAGRPGHHPRRRLGRDERRGHPHAPRGRVLRRDDHFVHAATLTADSYQRIAATGGSVSVGDGERAERRPGLPAHVGAARVRDPGVAVDGHQRVVERRPVLRHARHAGRRPLAGAPGGARARATR